MSGVHDVMFVAFDSCRHDALVATRSTGR